MFLQVIRGAVFEATAMRSLYDRWIAELSPEPRAISAALRA